MGMNVRKAKDDLAEIERGLQEFYSERADLDNTKVLELTRDLGMELDKILGFSVPEAKKEELPQAVSSDILRATANLDNGAPGKKLAISPEAIRVKLSNDETFQLLKFPERRETPPTEPEALPEHKPMTKIDDYLNFMSVNTELPKKAEEAQVLRLYRRGGDKVRASLFTPEYLSVLKNGKLNNPNTAKSWGSVFELGEVYTGSNISLEPETDSLAEISRAEIREELYEKINEEPSSEPDVVLEVPKQTISDEAAILQALTVNSEIVGARANYSNNSPNFFAELDRSIANETLGDELEILTQESSPMKRAA